MDIYIVTLDGHILGASAKLQGAELIRSNEAKRITTSTTQLDELRRMKVRTWALPAELTDTDVERLLYDSMHRCRYCGAKGPDVPLRVDHVVPVALGGSDDPSNLVTACEPCNSGKSSVPAGASLVADVAADAERWARAMQQAADELSAQADVLDAICDAVATRWRPRWIPSDFANSVFAFVKAGLTEADLLGLVDVALSARGVDDRWAYFCGCCWKRIKQRQELASEIVAAPMPDSPPPELLTTIWTVDEIEYKLRAALEFGREWWCDDVDSILTMNHCRHVEKDHCGDPVCAIETALMIFSAAWDHRTASERDGAVMATAEVDTDG